MPFKIQYDSETIRLAKDRDQGLFACGCRIDKGEYSVHGPLDHELAKKLTVFAMRVVGANETPQQAFKEVFEESE